MNKSNIKVFKILITLFIFSAIVSLCGCASCNENIDKNYSIFLEKKELSLTLGESYEIIVKTTGDLPEQLIWFSDNESVISVSDGVITANQVGLATVYVKCGDLSDSCVVKSSLGDFIPELKFSSNEADLRLVRNQEFVVEPVVCFNNKSYNDFDLSIISDGNILDYSIAGNRVNIKAKSIGSQSVIVTATWHGLTSEEFITLKKSLNVDVINKVMFSLNDKGLEDMVLYTCSEFADKEYANERPFDLKGTINGTDIPKDKISLTSDVPDIVVFEEGKIIAKKAGETEIKISYFDIESNTDYSNSFTIKVIRPEGVYPKIFEKFSSFDGTYKDAEDGYKTKSVISEIFGSAEITEAFDGENELVIEDGKIFGVVGNNDSAVQKTLTLGTEQYLYKINVEVYAKYITSATELTEIFGSENSDKNIEGYFFLGNDIDASGCNLSGGLRFNTMATNPYNAAVKASQFIGTFDGNGHVISNLDISGTTKATGSLFGQMNSPKAGFRPVVKNVAFENVKASYAAIISSYPAHNAYRPLFENIYVSVSGDTNNFRGIAVNSGAEIRNVIIEYPNEELIDSFGAFLSVNSAAFGSNNYLISKSFIKCENGEESGTFDEIVTRFESYKQMQEAAIDFSGFDSEFWCQTENVVLWKNLLKINVTKNGDIVSGQISLNNLNEELEFFVVNKMGNVSGVSIVTDCQNLIIDGNKVKLKNALDETEDGKTYVICVQIKSGVYSGFAKTIEIKAIKEIIRDDSERAVSVTDGTIDLEGLNFTIDQISEIEIAGTKYPITNGKLPSMELKVSGKDKLLLTIENDQKINIAKQSDKQDFDAIAIIIKLSDNTIYELSNVQFYTKVLKTAEDITELFGEANKANHLDGYYVLGNNIDASTANVKGALRFNTTANDTAYGAKSQFVGIFDGKGYTISNLDISGNSRANGSLFGQMTPNVNTLTPTVKNVAFKNVKASYAGIISSYARYNVVRPILENIYISVSKDTQNFRGLALNSEAITKNVIVEYPNEEYNNGFGAFVSAAFSIDNCSNCYLISKTYINQDDSGNEVLATGDGKVTRYESLEAMKAAIQSGLTLTGFNYCWVKDGDGMVVWKNL